MGQPPRPAGSIWFELADLVVPAACPGCGRRGTRWCPACGAVLAASGFPAGPIPVRPTPAPPAMPPVVAWGGYDGVVRSALVAYKDRDRRDLAKVLTPLLAAAIDVASGAMPGPVLVVPVPSQPAAVRRRGDRPLQVLGRQALRLATRGAGASRTRLAWAPCLRTVRGIADQAGLDHRNRAANLAGAFDVKAAWRPRVAGAWCLIIDDVVTTGVTLAEAARALEAAQVRGVACATIAATTRRNARHRPPGAVAACVTPSAVGRSSR